MQFISLEKQGRVAIVRLERQKARNALNSATMQEMVALSTQLDFDPEIGCIVITSAQADFFCAGADIKEMSSKSYVDMLQEDYFSGWEAFADIRTPKIAAVSGYAFGGGCELAMMCDIIYASQNAQFGQPEIKLGVIPGIGGTQRLTRLIGKAKAMEMILTGNSISASEAEAIGLVAQVFSSETLLPEVLLIAQQIAAFSPHAVQMAKELVNQTDQLNLSEGIRYERRLFHGLFATPNQKEGMSAFIEKRNPQFTY